MGSHILAGGEHSRDNLYKVEGKTAMQDGGWRGSILGLVCDVIYESPFNKQNLEQKCILNAPNNNLLELLNKNPVCLQRSNVMEMLK